MKRYIKSLMTVGLFSMALVNTSCIEDAELTTGATEEQIGESAVASKGLLMAMAQNLNAVPSSIDYHFQFGYGAMLHSRDAMCADVPVLYAGGYDWFATWAEGLGLAKSKAIPGYTWSYMYSQVQVANNVIRAINPENATEEALGYLGVGHAYRAMTYLDLARMYEFLPTEDINPAADGNDVTGLTVPIVTEATTQEESQNNPRATREEMFTFILSDLDKAEEYIINYKEKNNTMPHLDCVYGLKARLYMWVEDYANAAVYARKAIDESATDPMTETECLNTKTGFNDASKWMWGSEMTSEDGCVQTGIINWVSFLSNEHTFGYASSAAGAHIMISKALWDQIADTDFRKLMWKAPESSPLFGKSQWIDEGIGAALPDYASLKFRPNEGNISESRTAAASAFPLMRVEEMYLIEAEAIAHSNPEQGAALLNKFVKNYRDSKYSFSGTDKKTVVEEIILQKRIELWGEGQIFFDIKRLDLPVVRYYEGTNFDDDLALINTTGRPAWMNFVIAQSEENYNKAIVGYNNPDPTGYYTPIPRD